MSTKSPTGRDERSFEDVVLDLLLAVQDDLQHTPNRATRAWSRGPEHGRPRLRRTRERTVRARLARHTGHRALAAVALAGVAAAALVALLLVVPRAPGAKVVIRPVRQPAVQAPYPPLSVVVAQGGTDYGASPGTTVQANGYVDVYSPTAVGDAAPLASFTKGMYGPVTLAFDPSGDLWVANDDNDTIVELTKAELAKPNPVPSVTISEATPYELSQPYGMVFDRSGDLWVVSNGNSSVYEFTKSQLAKSGAPVPHTTITAGIYTSPGGDAFDSAGDLWLCTQNEVLEYSKHELDKANPQPTVTISSTGCGDLVFTPAGNLWLAWFDNDELAELTKSQLVKSGKPAPVAIISATTVGSNRTLSGPYPALSSSGDLWVSNFNGDTAVEFSPAQLSRSGSPKPLRVIAGPKTSMNSPTYVLVVP
jgi:streptogramin lyase